MKPTEEPHAMVSFWDRPDESWQRAEVEVGDDESHPARIRRPFQHLLCDPVPVEFDFWLVERPDGSERPVRDAHGPGERGFITGAAGTLLSRGDATRTIARRGLVLTRRAAVKLLKAVYRKQKTTIMKALKTKVGVRMFPKNLFRFQRSVGIHL